jgi:flagellar protein FlaG
MTLQPAGVQQVQRDAGQTAAQRPAIQADATRAAPVTPQPIEQVKVEPKQQVEAKTPISREELAEMLHRINLTFDLFEVAAKYSIDEDSSQIHVTLINTRTGEVIRRIPPNEFQSNFDSFREGLGLLFNQLF